MSIACAARCERPSLRPHALTRPPPGFWRSCHLCHLHQRGVSGRQRIERWSLPAGTLLPPCCCWAIGLLAGFGLGRPRIAPAAPLPGKIDVRIASLEGTVLVRHASRQIWEPLSGGATLLLGDTVHAAGKSAVTLSLWDRSSIRLDANTTLSADAFGGRVEFALSSGTINADLQSAHTPFFIRTPQGTLEALGTAFVVSVD